MGRSRVVWSEAEQRFVPADQPATSPRSRSAPARPAPPADRTQVQPRLPSPKVRITPPPAARATPPTRRAPADPPQQPPPPRGGRARRKGGAPAPSPPPRRPRRRRLVLLVLLLVVVLPGLLLAFGFLQYSRLEKVDVGGVLSPGGGGGTNYLIVGTDSREGIDPDDPNAGAFIGSQVTGSRTDTIMVLRVAGGQSKLLSIPRDLWVANAVTGEAGRINSTFQTSPAALIQTVQQSLGLPVHHYLEIGFPSFGALVDAVGGITVEFEHPARDQMSGLAVDQAGPVRLNGEQALAYVRSRQYQELVDGTWQADPTGDIGRTERQRAFLMTLLGEVGGSRNPLALARISRALGGGLRIDDTMTYLDTLRFLWDMKGLDLESVDLPVYGRTTSGGAAVLELDVGAADVLARFGATSPPAPPV